MIIPARPETINEFFVSQACQKYHWFVHKKHCARLKAQFEAREAANRKIEEKNSEEN